MSAPARRGPPEIPVAIEVSPSLASPLESPVVQALETLRKDFDLRLQMLGLEGRLALELRAGLSGRAVRVRLHERLRPFSPELMERVWLAIAPDRPDIPSMPGDPSPDGFPDGWVAGFLDALPAAGTPDRQLAADFVSRLAMEVVFEHPEALLGQDQLLSFAQKAIQGGRSSSTRNLRSVLEGLLSLGLLPPPRSVSQAMADGERLGRPIEDTIEALAVETRPDHVEIRLAGQDFAMMVVGDEERTEANPTSKDVVESIRKRFEQLDTSVFARLGVRPPRLVIQRDGDISPGVLRLKVNRLLTPPVPHSETNVAAAAEAELVRQSPRWFGIEDVVESLELLDGVFPALISATLERISLGELTRLLRGLLREGVSIIDLRAILERLLQYDTVSVDTDRYIVFDNRLAISPDDRLPPAPLWRRSVAFVRAGSGLRNRLTHEFGRGSPVRTEVPVIQIDEQLEHRGREAVVVGGMHPSEDPLKGQRLHEETQDEVLSSIWKELGRASGEDRLPPLLVRSEDSRAAIRDLIADELPDLAVLTRSELRPDVKIHRIGEKPPPVAAETSARGLGPWAHRAARFRPRRKSR